MKLMDSIQYRKQRRSEAGALALFGRGADIASASACGTNSLFGINGGFYYLRVGVRF